MIMRDDSINLNTPGLRILSEDQKETIFRSVLDVLEHTGVNVENNEGYELLIDAGAKAGSKQRVYIPSDLVEKALSKAPNSITIYNRLGKKALVLEKKRVYFCSQVDSTYFFDPFTGKRRECVRSDAPLGAILCDALPNIHMVSFSSLYKDVPGRIAIRLGHKDTVINCTKPIMHGTGNFANLKAIAEIAALIVGGWDQLAERPYYVHYAEPFSPLTHTDEGTAKLLFCVEHGIPVIYTPMTIGGVSAPVTGAGNLVACIAETLSGIVMSQIKKPGAPIIFGGVPTIMDMTSMIVSYGAPEMLLWSAALTEMGHYLNLPVFSTAGCTDAAIFDQQAAGESAMSCLMAALSGANLVHDVGFTEAANSASLELIAATDEFISMIGSIMKGIDVTPETLANDVINTVGPRGDYLGEEHTLKHFRENFFPKMLNRGNHEQWVSAGSLSLGDKANRKVLNIISEHKPEPLPPDIINELDKMEKCWWKEI